jgi:hypothetical protein
LPGHCLPYQPPLRMRGRPSSPTPCATQVGPSLRSCMTRVRRGHFSPTGGQAPAVRPPQHVGWAQHETAFEGDGPSACARDGFRRGWPERLRPRRLSKGMARAPAPEAAFEGDGPSACARGGFRRGWPERLRPRRLSKGMARAPAPEAAFEGDGPSACARDGFRRGWPERLRPRRLSKGRKRWWADTDT